jgi:hypothetical protein
MQLQQPMRTSKSHMHPARLHSPCGLLSTVDVWSMPAPHLLNASSSSTASSSSCCSSGDGLRCRSRDHPLLRLGDLPLPLLLLRLLLPLGLLRLAPSAGERDLPRAADLLRDGLGLLRRAGLAGLDLDLCLRCSAGLRDLCRRGDGDLRRPALRDLLRSRLRLADLEGLRDLWRELDLLRPLDEDLRRWRDLERGRLWCCLWAGTQEECVSVPQTQLNQQQQREELRYAIHTHRGCVDTSPPAGCLAQMRQWRCKLLAAP